MHCSWAPCPENPDCQTRPAHLNKCFYANQNSSLLFEMKRKLMAGTRAALRVHKIPVIVAVSQYLSAQGFEVLAVVACLSVFNFFGDLRLLVLTVLIAITFSGLVISNYSLN